MRPHAQRPLNSLLPSISRPCYRGRPGLSSTSPAAVAVPTSWQGYEDVVPTTCTQRRSITQNYIMKTKLAEEQWAAWAQEINEGKRQSFTSKLQERGLIQDVVGGDMEQLAKLITNVRAGFYAGFDATAPSLHVGHLVPLMILAWAYLHGMKANYVLGGSTGRFGDPTGRSDSRESMTNPVRKANITHMHMQLKKFSASVEQVGPKFGYEWEWPWRRALVNNNTWWNKEPLQDVMAIMGTHAKIGQMLSRDYVKTRLENGKGLSLAEFVYPVMQAWDYWVLFRKGIQIQVGGSDQYGNILFGVNMIKQILKDDPGNEYALKPQDDPHLKLPIGITTPLVTTSSGEKLGKSEDNAIWLDGDMTPPYDFYQYFMRLPDADMERFLKMFTFIPIPEISEIMEAHNANPSERIAQHKLARNVVTLVHGPKEAEDAERQHRLLFSNTSSQGVDSPADEEERATTNMNPVVDRRAAQTNLFTRVSPHVTLPSSLVVDQFFHKVLYAAGMVSSKQEGFRVIVKGGAHVGCQADAKQMMNDSLSFTPIKTWPAHYTKDFIIDGSLIILKIGKWKVKVVKIISDDEFEQQGLTAPGWKEGTPLEHAEDSELFRSKQKIGGHWVKPPAISKPRRFKNSKPKIVTLSRGDDGSLVQEEDEQEAQKSGKGK